MATMKRLLVTIRHQEAKQGWELAFETVKTEERQESKSAGQGARCKNSQVDRTGLLTSYDLRCEDFRSSKIYLKREDSFRANATCNSAPIPLQLFEVRGWSHRVPEALRPKRFAIVVPGFLSCKTK